MTRLGVLTWVLAGCCCCCLAAPRVREVLQVEANPDGNLIDAPIQGEDPDRQLSPATQSFLGALGTALGPIIGAIIGPLLSNIGQNLSAGSGAQAIMQLQEAQVASGTYEPLVPPPTASRPSNKPTRRPNGRPPRPEASPSRPQAPGQSYNSVVLEVPGQSPILLLMAANLSASAQAAAIQQAQMQATQFLSVRPGRYPQQGAQATKPTSAGELPPRPTLPSYHSLLNGEDGVEELAVPDSKGKPTFQTKATDRGKDTSGMENRVSSPVYSHEDDPLDPSLFPELES